MKKGLFFVAALALAAAFTSCDKDKNNPGGDGVATAITIQPTEDVVLSEGGSIKLTVVATPEGAKVENVTWETSDTLVATVNERGLVSAVYAGECTITATMGELKATRKVIVKSFLETIQFTQAILWDEDTLYAEGRVDTIEASNGTQYLAYKSMGELWLFSEGFFVNNEGYLDGAENAAVIKVFAPFYYATASLNHSERGTIFTLGEWAVSGVDSLQGRAHVGAPGAINEASYIQNIDGFFTKYFVENDQTGYVAYLQAAGDDFSGATITQWNYNVGDDGEGGYSYSSIPDGIITEGYFSLNTNGSSNYMCGLDFSQLTAKLLDSEESWWGVKPIIGGTEGAETYDGVENQIYWGQTINYNFGEVPAAAKKYEPLNVPVISIDCPEVAARIKKQMENSKVLIRK